ncbi:UDP-sugar transporter sqv-7 [Heracleum sosnowskyi]|uniref:UDP-sugar transporter sqv-7 n=1 Tax=Heracleum sosnowskyi TaxID=360622 RepID=A0AAD8N354_9APIA|nr:UDP-sugar transporter sqv-7 [Heracleum sosnowskyi]
MVTDNNQNLPLYETNDSKEKIQHASTTMSKLGVYTAVSYMLCAVLLIMFNKAALSSYEFPYVNVITLCQMSCSCVLLYVMRRWKIISFTVSEPHGKETNPLILLPLRTVLHTLPLAVSYLLYLLISMESVRGINVPMYTTLRRTTVAFTMLFEYFLTGQKHSFSVVGSVGIIIFGAIIAGARDLAFDSYSYAVVFTANICSAIYLASIARVGKSSGLNSFGLMWCNGLICTPFLLIWTYLRGDLEMTLQFPYLFFPGFQAVMVLSCLLAFLLNYTVFLNTTRNSALTQTICGNLKDLFTIGVGWLLFGGLPFDLMNVVGQSLGFLGSCLYAYCKLKGM